MCHPRHRLRIFFISKRSYVPFSRYSSYCIFNHPTIYPTCDVMSISTWDRVHFWIYLLNHNPLSYQTLLIDRCKQGQKFQESLEQFRGQGLSSRSFSISNLLQLLKYQLCQDSSVSFFWKLNKVQLKIANVSY